MLNESTVFNLDAFGTGGGTILGEGNFSFKFKFKFRFDFFLEHFFKSLKFIFRGLK